MTFFLVVGYVFLVAVAGAVFADLDLPWDQRGER